MTLNSWGLGIGGGLDITRSENYAEYYLRCNNDGCSHGVLGILGLMYDVCEF